MYATKQTFFLLLHSNDSIACEVMELEAADKHAAFVAGSAAAANWGRGNGSRSVRWEVETFGCVVVGSGEWVAPVARVEVGTANYEATYGRKPRGKGYWAFRFQTDRADGTMQERVEFAPSHLSYTDAKRWAVKRAAAVAAVRVDVAT